MEAAHKTQVPPLPRSSFERTITVVRGNRSLGMLTVFFMMLAPLCVYIIGMAMMDDLEVTDGF